MANDKKDFNKLATNAACELNEKFDAEIAASDARLAQKQQQYTAWQAWMIENCSTEWRNVIDQMSRRH